MTSERLQLAPRARLKHDRRSGRWVLLAPERGLILSPSAHQILHRLPGTTVTELIAELTAEHRAPEETIAQETRALLDDLLRRGLLVERP